MLVLGLAACVAEPPDVEVPDDEGVPAAGEPDPAAEDEEEEVPAGPVVLQIDAIPPSTTRASISITGEGPADGRILVQATAGSVSAAVQAVGTFCVDVPLTPDVTNEIVVQAVDQDGRYSASRRTTIEQRGVEEAEPVEVAPAPEPTDLADGGAVRETTLTPDSDWVGMLDGNPNTFVRATNAMFDDDWLVLDLAERGAVDRLVVRSTYGCTLQAFELLLTDAESTGEPTDGHGGWTTVWNATADEADIDREIEIEPMMARSVGIRFVLEGCSTFAGTGAHELREVEAWSTPAAGPATPPPQEVTCASAGR